MLGGWARDALVLAAQLFPDLARPVDLPGCCPTRAESPRAGADRYRVEPICAVLPIAPSTLLPAEGIAAGARATIGAGVAVFIDERDYHLSCCRSPRTAGI
jgi:hypothetical protein